jgi:precorrin-8X/cobalt-precorrin-8 methylmutase
MDIEKRSFEIISEKLEGINIDANHASVVKRVIHTTADFDYAENLFFSGGAVKTAKDALKSGTRIVTDTQMARAGINKKAAAGLGCDIHCFIDAPEVALAAQTKGVTRAWEAVGHAAAVLKGSIIFVVGNAPTALIRLHALITNREIAPVLIIAAPVGFVNVTESKELILELDVPHIVARGRKGGSNVAAAICNALFYEIVERDRKNKWD